ncbi:gamma-glutamyl-gamma-aminobutyrate hydrolase family protein [Halioxenophilus sp. WMMB6]|uniref:gamma-glutamyl-gamma-aminobutyrate hydrolase family protein n=1 Tax=Halioxenophilus sp. WMMB6 TaxID=3073815 RepID=UPI00295EDFA0|nr:gamma-glutamyl-gamma-aminobutyrate hydrolase family protein [Halioxenophilus sp. WMMB6]
MLSRVGFPACRKMIGNHAYHCVGEKYIAAVTAVVGAVPMLLPAVTASVPHDAFLDSVDGLLFTGSYSNVEPHHYGAEQELENGLIDPERDALTLELIQLAVARGMPVLGICRGFQEINVALGGSLYQQVHATGEHADHREDNSQSLAEQYDVSHPITIQPGGVLAEIWPEAEVMVNSLHGQGADRLAPVLKAEALAPDGLVEAISLPGKPLLGVQWHPEWQVQNNPFYRQIFLWFKQQVELYRATNNG